MLDQLPIEIIERVAAFLGQNDRVAVIYVCRMLRQKMVPLLYRNLYLNERSYCPSDVAPMLGNNWSALNFSMEHADKADQKFAALVRTLQNSPYLCSLVQRVHCTWHLDPAILHKLIGVLKERAPNLTEFENFLQLDVSKRISKFSKRLMSMDLPPPAVLPSEKVRTTYLENLSKLTKSHCFQNITSLTIYVDATFFFPNYCPLSDKLRIRDLCLSLRGDVFEPDAFPSGRVSYADIFDTNALQKLTILSWYETSEVDVYEIFHIFELLEFVHIRELSLMSLFANDGFLKECLKRFHNLTKLKLDYMLDYPVPKSIIELLSCSPARVSLRYLDLRFEELDPPLITIDQDEVSLFEVNQTCKCDFCKHVFENILFRKYFPTQSSLAIKNFDDVNARHVLVQLLRLYPIIPYAHFVDTCPPVAYRARPLKDLVKKSNELLNKDSLFYDYQKDDDAVTEEDMISIYHAHIHSLRRTYDYFLQRLPNLEYLNINEVPTMVVDFAGDQKCNIPIFYSENYRSNQVYEIVDAEELFS